MADKNFKSKAAYLKWIKYGHASGEFKETPGNQSVSIRNKNKKVEHTKYLDGGQLQIPPPDEATDADSLQVYNNAVQQQNYYNSLKEYYDKPTWKKTNIKSDVIKNITKEHLKHGNVSKTEKEKIKKGISSNIYYIKDMIPTAIDPNAPLAIYNPKIKPQGVIDYSPKGGLEINKIYKKYWNKISNDVDYIEGRKSDSEILSKYLSDNEYKKFKELEQINLTAQSNLQGIYTQLPYYSPLANKPAKLLTDKEVIKRFNQFGPSGISKERLKSLGLISKSNNTTTTSTSRTNTSKTSTPKIVKKEEPVLPEVVLDPSMFPEQQPIFDYVEPVATPAGKTNKIISYSAEPLMIKDATTGRLIKNPNRNPVAIDTQGNKIEQKAYGGQLQPPPDEPTFQDSLDVYNNSMKVQKYYNALPSEKTVNYLNAYKAQKKYSDSFLKDVTNKNKNVTKKISNDPDKYFFKDEIYGAIDENAPDIEYNTKIAPQGTLTYAPKGSNELYKAQKELRAKYKGLDTYDDESLRKNLTPTELKKFTKLVTTQANSSTQMPGQEVSVPYYSPLAIKPAKLLTDEEIIERVKKYGPTGIDPKKIESLGINIKALNKTTKPTTTKKVIPTTKPVEQVIIPTTVQKDSINTAVEQVITPTGKTNKVPGGIISYTSQPRFTKDKYGRVIPNTNTQTKENFVGYKQEKAYGGYINKIDAPEIGGYFRLKNQMADGGELQLMPNEDVTTSIAPIPQVQVPTYQGKPAPIYSGNFNQAFGEARKNGDEVFTWNNKVYGTKLASSTKKESAPVVNTNNTATVKPKVQKKEEPLQVAGKAGQYILDSINNISNPDTDTVISGIQAITNKIDTLAKKQKVIENIAKVAIKSNSNTSIKTKAKNTLIESRPIVDVKSPFLDENTEKTIMQRQNKDFVYSKFMNKGAEIRSRTDVGRLKESQKFLEDLVPELQFKGAKSLIIDIGSGLENPDENLRGVTVSELMSSKKIATSADIIATDIEPAYNKYKAGKKQMVDAYSLPVTFETPIKNVIRKREKDVKNKYNTIILRSANGIDLIMDEKDTYKHFDKVSKDTKEYPVYYMYNKHILYKPANTTTFSIIGELGEKGFDHRTSSWKIEDDSAPYNMRIGNTMNSVTPNQSPIRPAGMAYGGYINTPQIDGQFVRKMAKGGDLITKLSPKEETDFQNFYKTLPDNLKQDDNTYDLRGYWNSENRPSTFDYSQPVQSDGYYHAYSRNRYTDKILKAPTHETFRMAIEEDKKGGLAPLIGVDGNVYTKGEFISPIEDETGAPLNTNMLIDSRAYGGYINEMAKGGDIKYGSKEYNKAYREGTIARQVGDEYIMNLPDAEAMAEKYAVTAIDPRSIDPMTGERYPMWDQLPNQYKQVIVGNDPMAINARNVARQGHVSPNTYLADVRDQIINSAAEATALPSMYRMATGQGDVWDALGTMGGLGVGLKTLRGLNPGKTRAAEALGDPVSRLYNKVATGNSSLPFAWKSPAVGLNEEASQNMFKNIFNNANLTDAERAVVADYQYSSREYTGRNGNWTIDPVKRQAINDIIKKYNINVGDDAIATRKFNPENNSLGAILENNRLNFGDRPTSFSAGVGNKDYASGTVDRIVIPNRYLKKMGNKFVKNTYEPLSEEALKLVPKNSKEFATGIGVDNAMFGQEREIIGSGLNLKKIGKVKNDIGGYDWIVKPTKKGKVRADAATQEKAFGGYIDAPELNGYFKLKQ